VSPHDPRPGVDLAPYDGVVVLSFGGPERPEEVMPFLERVTAGRDIPPERLAEVAEHYYARGGVSPINAQGRALTAALTEELRRRGAELPVVLGNRNAAPFLVDTLRQLRDGGAARLLVLLTSAYSSYSSCRQYRENLADALAALAEDPDPAPVPEVDLVPPWFGIPAFVETTAAHLAQSLAGTDPATTRVLHVTHSLPEAMAASSGPPDGSGRYVDQHRAVMAAVDERVRYSGGASPDAPSELVHCSRSGPPHQPWLEPDVADRIRELSGEGVRTVVLVPIGFVSDHMEVVSDLDTDAVAAGREVGVEVRRVSTVGTAPALVAALVDLMADRAHQARGGAARTPWVADSARPVAPCPPGCCPNLRAVRPAVGDIPTDTPTNTREAPRAT
jgi:ferrochelatase